MGRVIKFRKQNEPTGKDSDQERIADKAIRKIQKNWKYSGRNTNNTKEAK